MMSDADGDDAAAYVAPRQAVDLGPRARQTIARIIDATRRVFITRGYGGMYSQIYADTVDRDEIITQAAQLLWGGARQSVPKRREPR